MTKTKTLCVCEWQAFGVDEIRAVLVRSYNSQNATFCHSERVRSTSEESTAQKERLNLQMDSSLSTKAQNDKERQEFDKALQEKATKIFKELQDFADEKGNFDDRTGNHIFLNHYGKNSLKARNYVGLIQTKSGFCLEILPKTFRDSEGFKIQGCTCTPFTKEKCEICKAKNILLNMLKTLKNSPFKQSHISNLKTQHLPLLEIFALMFLNELERLIKKGLKSDYVEREENRRFLKGKLLFSENLRQNFAHKERFFTTSDEFTSDIAPNRLIKSTLLLLARLNFSAKTSQKIAQSRFVFDEVRASVNFDKDFTKSANLIHYQGYENLLLWCKVFLKRQNFLPYQGSQKAFVLLFDMNVLFESFVAWCLKQKFGKKYLVKSQEKAKFLARKDEKEKGKKDMFQIRPDLVIYDKKEVENSKKEKNSKDEMPLPLIIADTKWKILNSSKDDYEISQSDLYQIFAYLAKYQCYKGYLIYPKIQGVSSANVRLKYKASLCFCEQPRKDGKNKEVKPHECKLKPHKDIELNIHFFKLEKYMQKIHGI
ncbi:McrC family protein [Campylobacter troglodytis]|uniref:McrC family protein n=1 Tax=Campylobacter troglodytis TaxID=654363 RepID=UPI001158B807|nr:McrC family protein [Campylobacter troglodytis]TQR60917.1 restriction endonuclease [Campylobacter troglodytis]